MVDNQHGEYGQRFGNLFTIETKFVKDLIKDKWIQVYTLHYLKLLLGTYGIVALIDWRIAVFPISNSSNYFS